MKQSYLILLAALATQGLMAETVTLDFMDVEATRTFDPLRVEINEAVALECSSAKVDNNLFLSSGTYMSVVSAPDFAISGIKVNFRPASVQDGVVTSDYNAYKFDTETNLAKPDYDSFIISPNGTISNPDYDSMIWSADGTPLSSVSFRNMRDNNTALSIESVEITYEAAAAPAPKGLPYTASGIDFNDGEWFYGPTVYVANFDGKDFALCDTEGEGAYEVVLIPANDASDAAQAIVIADYPDNAYNAVEIPTGEYTVAVKGGTGAAVSQLSLSAVPATWPAGRPVVTDVRLSDEIWHNITVDFSFPKNAWNGEPLADAEVNRASIIVNGKEGNNIYSELILEGSASYSWTAPTGAWSIDGNWKYAYNANMIPFKGAGGEMTLAPLGGVPGSDVLFDCAVDGASYYNQFTTINDEMNIRGNIGGGEFPFCSARPASAEYRHGWFVIFSNTRALRLNQTIDCWLILPVLALEEGKDYEVAFENEGITAEMAPVVTFLPTSEELSFDNMASASAGITSENPAEGTFAATFTPQQSGSYFIGLRLCNNDGDNSNGVAANISRITVSAKGTSAIDNISTDKGTDAYYDLMGRRISNPGTGSIVVKVTDGKSRKIIVR